MSLSTRISEDLKKAMREQNAVARDTLRMVVAELVLGPNVIPAVSEEHGRLLATFVSLSMPQSPIAELWRRSSALGIVNGTALVGRAATRVRSPQTEPRSGRCEYFSA